MGKQQFLDKKPPRFENSRKRGFIPFLGGRPKRTLVISKDDILNLTILLNTTRTVQDFLSSMEQRAN